MKTQEILNNYYNACEDVVEKINNLYFEGEADIDWVAEDIGGVAMIADYFLYMDCMITALKYGATEKQFFDWYEEQLKEEKPDVNFKNYILYYKGFRSE